jgi:glycosyltransferase involved in cell wall biosynthesis
MAHQTLLEAAKTVTLPTVSCICITRNRRVFLRRAIEHFQRAAQWYARIDGKAELVILDGSDESFRGVKYGDHPITYEHVPSSVLCAGRAHNEACEAANGDLIIQWDDDDWQHRGRIVRQVEALCGSLTSPTPTADFTYSSAFYWYHLERRRACRARSWDAGEGSAGALFAYWKDTWKKTPFEDVAVGEDIGFFSSLHMCGAKMHDAKDPELVVYMRHNQNGSALTNYLWDDASTAEARRIIGPADCDFYDGIGELLPVAQWNHPNAPGSRAHILSPLALSWGRHFR